MSEMREIPGYDGYHCDREGRVFTTRKLRNYHQMTPAKDRCGYLFLHLTPSPGKRRKNVYVHHLVATTWVGARPDGAQINHKNASRDDNRADNLEWVSLVENLAECWTRTKHERRGEKHHNAVVSDAVVQEIRSLRRQGVKRAEIVARFGLSVTAVKNILTERSRVDV